MSYIDQSNISELFRLLGEKFRDNLWKSDNEYREGELLVYEDKLYRVKENFISGETFDATHLQTLSYSTTIPQVNVENWVSNKHYNVSNLVKYENAVYFCVTENTSSSDFMSDYNNGYWKQLDMNLVVSGNTGFVQFNLEATTSPYTIYLPIQKTRDFCLPKPEILREGTSSTNNVTMLDYNSDDSSKFSYDNDSIELDGSMHIKTRHNVPVSSPSILGNGYISNSDSINFSNYRSVSSISIGSSASDDDTVFNIITDGESIIDTKGNQFEYRRNPTSIFVDSTQVSPIGNHPINVPAGSYDWIHLLVQGDDSLDFYAEDDFTFCCWAKVDLEAASYYATFINGGRGYGYQRFEVNIDKWRGDGYSPGWVDSSSSIFGNKSFMNDLVGVWHHYALVKSNNIFYIFVDGELCVTGSNQDSHIDFGKTRGIYIFAEGFGDNNAWCAGLYDDVLFVKKALWTENFNVPSTYILNPVNAVYLSGNNAYGVDSTDTFSQLSSNWSSLSANEKENIFLSIGNGSPSIEELSTLQMPINISTYSEKDSQQKLFINAIPLTGQIVLPTELIDLSLYDKLKQIKFESSIDGSGVIKILLTTDLHVYKKYNSTGSSWEVVDINNIATQGMSPSLFESITDLEELDAEKKGIAFAYYINIDSITDKASIDTLQMNLKFFAELFGMGHGSYYNYYSYSYPTGTVLKVVLNYTGVYKINYCPGG